MKFRIALAIIAPTLSVPAWASEWRLRESVDQITDLQTASASISPEDGASRLIVKCDGVGKPVVSVQILTKEFLGQDDERPLTLRFDQREPLTFNWEYVLKGAFNRDEKMVRSLAHLMARGGELRFRAFDYQERPVDGLFALPEGDAVLRRVFHACNYNFDERSAVKMELKN